jgi:hypothetical protein
MNFGPPRQTSALDLSLRVRSARRAAPRLAVVFATFGIVFVAPLVGIWMKNRVEATFRHNNALRERIELLTDAIAREEIAIRQLSTFETIEPLARARVGLGMTDPSSRVFVPVAAPPAAPPEPLDEGVDRLVALARRGADWVLPARDVQAGD